MAMINKRTSKTTGKTSYLVSIRKRGVKPIYKTFPRKALALVWAQETELQIAKDKYTDYSIADNFLLTEAIDKYIVEVLPRLAQSTHQPATSKLNTLSRNFQNIAVSKLSVDNIMDYVQRRKNNGIAQSTILKDLDWLNSVYKSIVFVWGVDCVNPVPQARTKCQITRELKPAKGRERRPTNTEIEALTTYSKENNINLIIAFAIETAMRRSEITNIKRDNIDYQHSTLYIPKTKTNNPRTIPLTKRAIEILQSINENVSQIDGKIFTLSSMDITIIFRKVCNALDIDDLKFHDLRHEAISRLFEINKLNVMEVAAISGHKTLTMLMRYTHISPKVLAKKLNHSSTNV